MALLDVLFNLFCHRGHIYFSKKGKRYCDETGVRFCLWEKTPWDNNN